MFVIVKATEKDSWLFLWVETSDKYPYKIGISRSKKLTSNGNFMTQTMKRAKSPDQINRTYSNDFPVRH